MKKIILILLVFLGYTPLFCNDNTVCKKCHPLIYKEYYNSIHRKSSLANDKIYKAVFEKEHAKKQKCNSCHAPSAKNSQEEKEAPISCIYCHTIKNIAKDDAANKNILTGKKKDFFSAQKDKRNESKVKYETTTSFFGLIKRSKNSPYHQIEYNNENYYNGNVCMGCHSHVNNAHNFDIIMLDAYIDQKDKNTCISCHMPQVTGSKTTLSDSKTHAYHGIAGLHRFTATLGKYIDFQVQKNEKGFQVTLKNLTNHALFGQAYREGILNVTVVRGKEKLVQKPYIFTRIFGKDKEESMPFEATNILKDTLIYAKKNILYTTKLQKGDKVILTLGFRLISKKAAKELDLQNDKKLTKIKILKTETFSF
ncbi:cytochrome c family protein [Sulfurimonas sp. SWIR-19]|uniref:cytochrome c family protein n=1 Tax=Sulfurimonas sp. SWIR-19 TaxID=2878390 RepID=UPI001CF2F3F3|nr:cytochrome c family protein [Sulfurimonas sp. SWIR-19]UCM99313.1 cytochrome c family protein [Sulfurimonas sp. SWIR-19]